MARAPRDPARIYREQHPGVVDDRVTLADRQFYVVDRDVNRRRSLARSLPAVRRWVGQEDAPVR